MEIEGEGNEPGPRRLIITEMVLENFKSYAGEQRVGPFHKVLFLTTLYETLTSLWHVRHHENTRKYTIHARYSTLAFHSPRIDALKTVSPCLQHCSWLVSLKMMWMLQCFSSVVGPNGSGKSNVIDAMLFVFGKKAKQVRKLQEALLSNAP
jgi:AAA15 family ATPase/GTPase